MEAAAVEDRAARSRSLRNVRRAGGDEVASSGKRRNLAGQEGKLTVAETLRGYGTPAVVGNAVAAGGKLLRDDDQLCSRPRRGVEKV
jgi:hypothetical protein